MWSSIEDRRVSDISPAVFALLATGQLSWSSIRHGSSARSSGTSRKPLLARTRGGKLAPPRARVRHAERVTISRATEVALSMPERPRNPRYDFSAYCCAGIELPVRSLTPAEDRGEGPPCRWKVKAAPGLSGSRIGSWRDLPAEFRKWSSAYRPFPSLNTGPAVGRDLGRLEANCGRAG